jgi:pyrrolysine biosynthesis protein PylD
MTRLLETDIIDIPKNLAAYDAELIAKTGCTLFQIACHAMGISESSARDSIKNARVGVIPITTGLGRLQGFCKAVAAIVKHMGCQAFVCQQTDVAGIVEAIASEVEIIMMADEQQFIAINLYTHKIADNAEATAKGFVTALYLMAGSSLKDQRVLVLGCGPVGQHAVNTLLEIDGLVSIYDIDPLRSGSLLKKYSPDSQVFLQQSLDLEDALLKHTLIMDATPAGAFIQARHIKAETKISAPGMPLGLDPAALAAIDKRLIHDPLQIGVATMLIMAAT